MQPTSLKCKHKIPLDLAIKVVEKRLTENTSWGQRTSLLGRSDRFAFFLSNIQRHHYQQVFDGYHSFSYSAVGACILTVMHA